MCTSSIRQGKGKARAGLVADIGFSLCAGMTHVTVLFWQCFCTQSDLFGSAAFMQSVDSCRVEDHSSIPFQ